MKGCPIILLLAGCAADAGHPGDGGCPGSQPGCDADTCWAGGCPDEYVYACDEATGEWVPVSGVCEANVVYFAGRAPLAQSVETESGACPSIVPRAPLVLDARDDGTLAVAAPAVLVSGENNPNFEYANVHAIVDDDWYGRAVEVTYDLGADTEVLGMATATIDTCALTVYVEGPVCPPAVEPCATTDAGWTAQCQNGVVRASDRTTYSYCAHGATTPACSVGGARDSIIVTCPAACVDEAVHDFATTGDFLAFAPASLCG